MDKFTVDKQQLKTNHSHAADYYQKAADYHSQAAKHHEAGEHERGNAAAHQAHGHTVQAVDHASHASKQSAGIQPEQ